MAEADMRAWFDKLTIGLVIVLSLPTALVILTWNSLPGNFDYPIKLAMENLLLFVVSPSYAATGNLNIVYTERRYYETKQLLVQKQSPRGLILLSNQVHQTKTAILGAQNQDAQTRELATRYIATLETVKSDLEEQKISLVSSASNPPPPRNKPTTATVPYSPTPPPRVDQPFESPMQPPAVQPAPTSTEPETTQEVVTHIEETQEVIEQTIEELREVRENQGDNRSDRGEQMSNQAPGQQEDNNGKDQNGKDKGKGKD